MAPSSGRTTYTDSNFSVHFYAIARLYTAAKKEPAGLLYPVHAQTQREPGSCSSPSLSHRLLPSPPLCLLVSVFRHTGGASAIQTGAAALYTTSATTARRLVREGNTSRRRREAAALGGGRKGSNTKKKKLSERPPVSAQLVRLPWAAHPKKFRRGARSSFFLKKIFPTIFCFVCFVCCTKKKTHTHTRVFCLIILI